MTSGEVVELFKEYGRTITREGLRYLIDRHGLAEKDGYNYVYDRQKVIDYLEGRFTVVRTGRPPKITFEKD